MQFEFLKLDVKTAVHPMTNATVYDLVSTQLYLDHQQIFDVLEHIVVMAFVPIFNFVIVVIATSATVVQLKRVIVWRKRASTNVDGTEVKCYIFKQFLLLLLLALVVVGFLFLSCLLISLFLSPSPPTLFPVFLVFLFLLPFHQNYPLVICQKCQYSTWDHPVNTVVFFYSSNFSLY